MPTKVQSCGSKRFGACDFWTQTSVAGNAARQRLLIAISHGVKRNIRCQKLKRNNTANEFYTVRKETLLPSGVQGGGAGEGRPTPYLKISGQTLFSGQAQVAQKSRKIKNISIQWKISRQILFFRASAGCSKVWRIKNIYSIQWIQCTFFFRESTSCSKNLNAKTIFDAVKYFRKTLFSERAQVPQNLLFQCSENFQGKLCFSGQAKVV